MSRKIFFFSKFQKRSKKVEKMILSPMEVVSEWVNREKMVKKRKMKKISEISTARMEMK